MALFPCDDGGHRYPGGQNTAYPAIALASKVMRSRRRLCGDHFRELSEFCEKHFPAADDFDSIQSCALCGSYPALYAVFVTLYGKGEERRDVYGRACEACAAGQVVHALFGATTRLETI